MTAKTRPIESSQEKESTARSSRLRLPGFLDDSIGLGDLLARGTRALGIPTCGGCQRRAEHLNAMVSFAPRRERSRT